MKRFHDKLSIQNLYFESFNIFFSKKYICITFYIGLYENLCTRTIHNVYVAIYDAQARISYKRLPAISIYAYLPTFKSVLKKITQSLTGTFGNKSLYVGAGWSVFQTKSVGTVQKNSYTIRAHGLWSKEGDDNVKSGYLFIKYVKTVIRLSVVLLNCSKTFFYFISKNCYCCFLLYNF